MVGAVVGTAVGDGAGVALGAGVEVAEGVAAGVDGSAIEGLTRRDGVVVGKSTAMGPRPLGWNRVAGIAIPAITAAAASARVFLLMT